MQFRDLSGDAAARIMKAIVYREYGSSEVLRLEEIEKPALSDAEMLIRVRAAEVTKADCELRSFSFPVKWFWLPLRLVLGITRPRRQVLGMYFSGEVEAVGKDVSKLEVGDQVFGFFYLLILLMEYR